MDYKYSSTTLLAVCCETETPNGSPLTERKLYDFLTVNGNFINDIHPSSNCSTRTSSLRASPMPPYEDYEINNQTRRMSLTSNSDYQIIPKNDEFQNVKKEIQLKNRRHSIVTTVETKSGRSSPTLISWTPIHCVQNIVNSTERKNDNEQNSQTQQQNQFQHQNNEDENGNPSYNPDDSGNIYKNCDVNVWLRSCEKEIIEPIKGISKGQIPKWLNGSLIRNGPGSLKVGDMEFQHLFDASALLHRFGIKDGNVTYQCRFLQSNTYKKNMAAKRIVVSEFGTSAVPDPCQSIFQRISALFTPGESTSDNAMISVYPFGDEYFVFTESPVIHKINPETLNTEKRLNLSNLIGVINHTSHPHVMADGTVYNLGMTVTKYGPEYNIICFPHGENMFENAHIVGHIPARWKMNPSYMHTFGITENYFVIVEQPLTVSVPMVLKTQLTNKQMSAALKWLPDKETYIYLLERKTGEIKYTYHTESFFYLHIINQYEKDDHVILDICCYKNPAMLNCMYINSMKDMQNNPDYAKMFRGRPLRFVLPTTTEETKLTTMTVQPTTSTAANVEILEELSTIEKIFSRFNGKHGFKKIPLDEKNVTQKMKNGNCKRFLSENLVKLESTQATAFKFPDKTIFCTPELLCDLGCETPRINYEKYLGKEYRYFYAISSDVDAEYPGTLIKVDVKSKTRKTWCELNCYPSEPIFVASPESKSEDDGVILAAMVWGNTEVNRVGLLVLCAKTWMELGRCEFKTESPVPKCLHGWFKSTK